MAAFARHGATQVAVEVARLAAIEPYGVQIWTACPGEPDDAQWGELALLLDATEQVRAGQFRREADRRAYVLAHALRRAALARTLAVDPDEIAISHEATGRPVLTSPSAPGDIFFSHSRSRDAVACAVTRAAPVGIDIESIDGVIADFDLLAPYAALPDPRRCEAELGPYRSRQFFFYWTALEAFWKAAGTGLSPANPRIRCAKNLSGMFEIGLETDGGEKSVGRVIPLQAPAGCSLTLALYTAPKQAATDETPTS